MSCHVERLAKKELDKALPLRLTALSQPAYKSAQHVGIIIGPDALSRIRRQHRPKSRVGEHPEILILPGHRSDNRDPFLFARIFFNVAAVIEARDRGVCMRDAGHNGRKLKVVVRHVDRHDTAWLEFVQIDRHRLRSEEMYRYRGADESINKDQIETRIGRILDR